MFLQKACFPHYILHSGLMQNVQWQHSHMNPFTFIYICTHIQVHTCTQVVCCVPHSHLSIHVYITHIAAINNTHMHLNNEEHPRSASQHFVLFSMHVYECVCVSEGVKQMRSAILIHHQLF